MKPILTPSRRIITPDHAHLCERCGKRIRRRRSMFWPQGVAALNMAAGSVLLDDDGKVRLDDDGRVMLSDGEGDECCCGEDPCGVGAPCGSPHPPKITVVVSGVNQVECSCIKNGLTFGRKYSWQLLSPMVVNGTWEMTQGGPDPYNNDLGPCGYFKAYPGVNDGRAWSQWGSDPNCSGDPISDDSEDYVTAVFYNPAFLWTGYFTIGLFLIPGFFWTPLFLATMPGTWSFCEPIVLDNLFTSPSCGPVYSTEALVTDVSFGYGGTATLIPST